MSADPAVAAIIGRNEAAAVAEAGAVTTLTVEFAGGTASEEMDAGRARGLVWILARSAGDQPLKLGGQRMTRADIRSLTVATTTTF